MKNLGVLKAVVQLASQSLIQFNWRTLSGSTLTFDKPVEQFHTEYPCGPNDLTVAELLMESFFREYTLGHAVLSKYLKSRETPNYIF